MVIRIYALLLVLVCACKFDERDFGDRLCVAAEDCPRPDQDCIQNTCTQKSCSSDSQCGTSHDFACVSGVCVVDTCTDTDCEPGYACMEGFCQASFNVTTVVSTSNTSIAITFDSPPDATTAAVLGNYVVDGLTLSGTPSLSGTTVTLTTSPQTMTQYKASVAGVTRDFDKASLIVDEATFTGRNPFLVASAISTSAITVAVTFSEPPDPATALNLANYTVTGLTVSGTPTLMGNTVTIKTSSQSQNPYTVTVANVRRAADAEALTTGIAVFTGRNDFNIATATPKTSTTIEVAFDAAPNAAAANTMANYTIPGLTITSAVLRAVDNTVVLTVSPQDGLMYTVTVANVARASDGEVLTVNNRSFMGRTPFNVADAISKTSTSIELTFDAAPNAAQATILSNYSIPNLTLTGTPVLAGNVVTLTTAPQNAQLYNITVNNVTRTDDEALTEKVATFTGRKPFNVSVAAATSSTSVAVTFDAPPNPGQATQLTNYSIPGLTIVAASLNAATVTLTTSPQAGMTTYAVTVANVSRADDGELLTNATANFAGRAPFNVMNVMTPSSTSIAIVFDAAPNAAQATTLGNYNVSGLAISGTPVLAGNTVTITTAPQLAQNYTVTVANVRRSVDAEALTVNSYQFAGRPRFNVMGATSTSNVSMTVTFDAPPNPTQAMTLGNYNVPGLTLMGTPALNGNTVTITTSSQTGGAPYTVTVSNVTRNSDTEPLFTNTANFNGRAGFNVTSATSVNTTTISVTFDAAPNAGQAQTLANYSVPGLTLSGTPTLNAATNTVTITTSPQAAGQYTVSVSNVTRNNDASPLVINSAQFTYVSFNVASAVSVTNRSIAVTFDAPPTAAQATNLANYNVPGLTLSGTPVLAGSTVTIQTSSQAVQTYTVTVNNVTRMGDGSTLANKTATFTGRLAFTASVVSQTSGSIQVTYSQLPNAAQATTLANYTVGGLMLMGTPVLTGNTVTIQTAIQTNTNYTLTVNNVTRAGDAEPLFPNMYSFVGQAQSTPTIVGITIQSTVPDNGTTFYNTGKATLVITGTEFTGVQCAGVTLDDRNGANVLINTPAESCTVNTATQITATFPAGIRTNGTTGWSVRVTNGVGTGVSTAKVVVKAGLLVSEVMIGQGGGGGNVREFFELYNPTANSINVSNLGLVVHIRSGTTDMALATTVVSGRRTIASHGFMLFTTTASSADTWWNNRDSTYDAAAGELVGNGTLYLSLSATPQVMVLDKLGWGSAAADVGREGTATANLSNGQSVQRKPAGGGGAATDTDNNLTDFNVQSMTTTPKGTQQPSEP